MKKALILFIILLSFLSSYAQKVKYKDVWGLLNTKQYEAAEPFLKQYLKENDDNPNAYLYMGIVYHEKSAKDDVLKQTKRAIANMDSAILFYDKAYKTINEKEIKRNSDYYQSYNRRDLRTGEFGVKLSDVQFDIEKKMEGLRERIDRIKTAKRYFVLADSLYKKTQALFIAQQQKYPAAREFFLRADEGTLKNLNILGIRFDSCIKAFDQYKASAAMLGRTGYNQTLTRTEIRDFKTDGTSPADFYQSDLRIWDYKSFAEKAALAIKNEIIPMRQQLVAHDIEINKLREKLTRDSVSIKSDLLRITAGLPVKELKRYDPDPLPLSIFGLKSAELEYRSTLLENRPLYDSANVRLHVKTIHKELKMITALDSTAGQLLATDLDAAAENYASFVSEAYNNAKVLKSYVRTLKDYAAREIDAREKALQRSTESLRWIISAGDSIPLFMDTTWKSPGYKPLVVMDEKYTVGLHYKDSLGVSGYLCTITPSHLGGVKINFPVDKQNFKLSHLPEIRSLTLTDDTGEMYFVLVYGERPAKDNKYLVTLAKLHLSGGLIWSNQYTLSYLPKELAFKPETGDLLIKAEAQQSVVDKNGKLLK